MATTSSALKLAKFSAFAALCAWTLPAAAQGAGAAGGGMGGAGGTGGMSAGGAGGQSGGGGDATGGMSGGGGVGGDAAGGMSGGGLGGAGAGGQPASAGTGGSGGTPAGGTGGTASTNLITNGTFDTTSYAPWWPHAAESEENPAAQTLAVTDGRLCSTITMGGANVWDVIVGYSGVSLAENQHYRISFSVSADADRTIKFKTGFGDVPYTDYFIKSIPISATPQTIEYTYLNLRTDAMAQFQYQIGGTPGTVCFDDVVLEPVAAPATPAYQTPAPSGHPFKDYKAIVKMGTAVDTPIFLSNPLHNAIVAGEFGMITPANSMKMNIIQPLQGTFDFVDTDALAAWAQTNGLEFRGHPLVWHTQVPDWLSSGTFDRDQMIAIMYAHIDTIVARYAGRFPYWDVVNEAIDKVGDAWTFRPTLWHDRIGPDFIDLAFTRARMADPNAKLLYNDYNIEQKGNAKADRVFELVKDMKTRGIPIDAIGMQGHYFIEPSGSTANGVPNMQAIRDNMARYAEIGVDVHITESDFRIGKPLDDNKVQTQNKFYADLLKVCIEAPNCTHFTLWGLSDVDSWVPSTFEEYDYAHIFDAQLMPKPSYFAMSDVFAQYNVDGTPIGGQGGGGGMAGIAGSAGSPGSAGSAGSTSAPPAAAAKKDSGGCSFAPSGSGTAPWVLAAFAALGLLVSRRRAKQE